LVSTGILNEFLDSEAGINRSSMRDGSRRARYGGHGILSIGLLDAGRSTSPTLMRSVAVLRGSWNRK
jgi:hypothetical protein